jgi:hypothetical protein
MTENDDGKKRDRCPMVLNPTAVAALFTEVLDGEYDGKPVMVLAFRGVMPDGTDFKLGFSEPAAMALMARCVGFKRHINDLRQALDGGDGDGGKDKTKGA